MKQKWPILIRKKRMIWIKLLMIQWCWYYWCIYIYSVQEEQLRPWLEKHWNESDCTKANNNQDNKKNNKLLVIIVKIRMAVWIKKYCSAPWNKQKRIKKLPKIPTTFLYQTWKTRQTTSVSKKSGRRTWRYWWGFFHEWSWKQTNWSAYFNFGSNHPILWEFKSRCPIHQLLIYLLMQLMKQYQ